MQPEQRQLHAPTLAGRRPAPPEGRLSRRYTRPVRWEERVARKVPAVALLFWVAKILTTAMGEATSDYLVHTISPYIAVGIGALGLVVALALQLSLRRYVAWAYWFAVAMVAVFGTMAADAVHIELGVPYWLSASMCAVGLTAIFVVWYLSERTLSIHSITTMRRELFYWAAVLATFAMGTAVGDMTAYTLHLGFFASGLMFTVVFAIPFVARRLFGLHEVFAFWFAYIITRPLGASYADWLGVPKNLGGLNYGRGTVSIALTIAIVLLVGYLSVTRIDVERGDDVLSGGPLTADQRSSA
jgi:uncharacterized membrane-anchored protein